MLASGRLSSITVRYISMLLVLLLAILTPLREAFCLGGNSGSARAGFQSVTGILAVSFDTPEDRFIILS